MRTYQGSVEEITGVISSLCAKSLHSVDLIQRIDSSFAEVLSWFVVITEVVHAADQTDC